MGRKSQKPTDPVKKAKSDCLRLLAVKPRTRADLAKALARKGHEPDVAEQVLVRLEKARLIDDAEYADMLVRSRHTYQGLGRRALKSELVRKGVAATVADEAVGTIDAEQEEARARELVGKRVRSMASVDDTTATRRLVGMLARKGYPEGLAYRVVREALADAERDTSLLDQAAEG